MHPTGRCYFFPGGAARGVVDALQEHVFNEDLLHFGERRQKADGADEIMGILCICIYIYMVLPPKKPAFSSLLLVLGGGLANIYMCIYIYNYIYIYIYIHTYLIDGWMDR